MAILSRLEALGGDSVYDLFSVARAVYAHLEYKLNSQPPTSATHSGT